MSAVASRAFASGLVGATVLTVVHEGARVRIPNAPRMDILGMRALARLMRWFGTNPPAGERLHRWTLAADLVSNALYYSGVAARTSRETWQRGVALGALAGVGAIGLPKPLGLGAPPNSDSRSNRLMTLSWYIIGGLAAAAVANALRPRRRSK